MIKGHWNALTDKYGPAFLALVFLFISCAVRGQAVYRPSNTGYFTPANKPYGLSTPVPTDGRTYKADTVNGLFRPYNGTAEILSYLPTGSQFRVGQFPIVANIGGTLQSNGTFIGGQIQVWWFLRGQADSNLVRMDSTGSGTCTTCLLKANNLSDVQSLFQTLINLNLNNVDNTSDATKNSATATLTNKTISGLNNTFSNIPNSALVNNSIGLTLNNSGSSPAVSTTPAALGTSLVLSIPFASGSNSGFLSNTFFTSFLGKVDSTSQSNDTVYDWHNGSATFRYVIVGGSGGIALLNGLSASTQTFATGTSGSDFNIVSAVSTHTFNFPNSSASNRGLLTSTDWSTFAAKQNAITPSNTIDQYWNGFENFVNLNTDSITEGTNHQFYTDARARAAISITTSGSSGPATYNNSTGVLNVPNYTGGSGTDTTTLVLPSLTRSTAGTIITLGLNVANANTWTALQTYNNNIALASNITFGTDNTYAIGTPTVGANAIYSRNVESDGILGLLTTASNPIIFAPNSVTKMTLLASGQLQLNGYTTSTSFTGTPNAFLQSDASGDIIQTAVSSIQTSLSNTPSGGFPLFNANSSAIRELFSGTNVTIDSTTHAGGYTINASGGGGGGVTIYVAQSGISTGVGSTPATAISFSRLITLSSSFSGGERIYLQSGGVYYGDLTIQSGTYIGKYGSGTRPMIRGTILSNSLTWTQSGTIWSASVASRATRLFLNNSPQPIAQSPFYTITTKNSSTSITSTGATGLGSWVTSAEMIGKEYSFRWFYNTITAYNSGTGTFTLDANGNASTANNQFRLINDVNLITNVGDWAWESGTVYYKSPGNVNPNTLNVELSVYSEAITAPNNSSNITIEGIDFFGQAADGVYMDSVSDITIRDCQFKNQFNAGITLLGNASRANIVNIKCDSICNNGISFNQLYDSHLTGDTITNIGMQANPLFVRDNSSTVNPSARYPFPINKQLGIGVSCYANSSKNIIENSVTGFTAYSGFVFSSNYSTIRNCQAHDFTLRQNDGGGIYVYADSVALFPTLGWKNVYGLNIFNDYCYNGYGINEAGAPEAAKGNGIYIDNGTRGTKIYGNTIRNCSQAAVFLNWNVLNIDMNGNTFYNNPYGVYINDDSTQDGIAITGVRINNNTFAAIDSSHGFQYGVYMSARATAGNFSNGGNFSNNIFITPYSNIILFWNGSKNVGSAQAALSQSIGFSDPVSQLFVDSTTGTASFPIDINNTLSTRRSITPLGFRNPLFRNQDYTLGANESAVSILGTIAIPGKTGFFTIYGDSGLLKPSIINQVGSNINIPGQIDLSGSTSGIDFTARDNSSDAWKQYSAAGELTFHNNTGGDRLVLGKASATIGATFFPTGSVSFPAAFIADGAGRGPIIMGNSGTPTNFSTFGLQFAVGSTVNSLSSYSNINSGTTMQLALNSAGGKVLVNDITSRTAAALQVRSATGPQLSLVYDNADTVDLTVNSSASLGLTGLTGLTLPTSAIPAGSTADSSFVFETVAGVMTVKKALIAGGGSSYTFTNGLTNSSGTVSLGGTLTGPTSLVGTGQTFTYTAGGSGLWKYSGLSHDTTASFGLLGFANDSSVRAFSWAAVAAKVSPLLPTFTINTHNGLYASGGDSVGLGTNPLDQNTTINTAGFNFLIEGSLNVNASSSTAISGPALTINGNVSATTSTSVRGYWLNLPRANTFTEGSSGTLAQGETVFLGDETFAAGSATTYTNAATLFINGPPAAGSNVTITNPWAIFVFSGNCFLGSNVSTFTGGSVSTTHILGNNLTGGGSAPSITAGAGAGTSPTVSMSGDDMSGTITVTTGTLPTGSATVATITYNLAFPNNSYASLYPANAVTAALGSLMVYTTGSTTNFTLTSPSAGLAAATTYKWVYRVGGN